MSPTVYPLGTIFKIYECSYFSPTRLWKPLRAEKSSTSVESLDVTWWDSQFISEFKPRLSLLAETDTDLITLAEAQPDHERAPVTCLPIVTVAGHSDQKSRVCSKSFPRQSTEHSSFADRKIICFIHRGISVRHSCEERSKLIKSRCLGGPGPRHISAFTKPCQRVQPQQSIKIFNVLSLPLYLHHW